MRKVGILNIQGASEKHAEMIRQLGHEAREVRSLEALMSVDAIILPGGESTSIGKQLQWYGLLDPLREQIQNGLPVFGTCAGLILLAKTIEGSDQIRIGAMDISVRRNAYGAQLESFEAPIDCPDMPAFPALFIRAPEILSADNPDVQILATCQGRKVMARQKNILVATFHPELTENPEIHRYFLEKIA